MPESLGNEDSAKCCCRDGSGVVGRWKRAEVSLKRAVLHSRATKMYESVAQARRAAPSGDDKCGFRCRRVSFIHTSFSPAPLGNGKARKSRLTVPRVTFGCGTVRRHRSRRARPVPCPCRWRGSGGRSHGRAAIISGHISMRFGNFYYFCPDTCHDVTSRAGDSRQERDTDRKGDRWSPSYLPKHR